MLQHVGVLLKDRHDMQQEIAEIGRVQRQQTRLIGSVKLGPHVVEMARLRGGHLFRSPCAVLPTVDQARKLARGPTLFVDIGRCDHLFQQAYLVVGIENGEVGLEPHQFRMAAQDLHRKRMEGAHPRQPFDRAPHQPSQAFLHLARGLVGEGHGHDLIRAGKATGQDMCDPGGERAGLAGARPRQHQDRPLQRLDGLPLRRVQPVHIGRWPRGHRAGGQGSAFEGVGFVETAHARQSRHIAIRIKDKFTLCSA